MATDYRIPLALNEDLLRIGENKFVYWEMNRNPHAILFGNSGSGKTYCSLSILARIALYIPESEIFVCDYKGDTDYSFLEGCKRFYRYDECTDGLNAYYDRFLDRRKGIDKTRFPLILYYDEWASFINSSEKRDLEQNKKILSNLLMLGRSFFLPSNNQPATGGFGLFCNSTRQFVCMSKFRQFIEGKY